MKNQAYALQILFDLLTIAKERSGDHISEYTQGALDALTLAFGILATTEEVEDLRGEQETTLHTELYQAHIEQQSAPAPPPEKKSKRK